MYIKREKERKWSINLFPNTFLNISIHFCLLLCVNVRPSRIQLGEICSFLLRIRGRKKFKPFPLKQKKMQEYVAERWIPAQAGSPILNSSNCEAVQVCTDDEVCMRACCFFSWLSLEAADSSTLVAGFRNETDPLYSGLKSVLRSHWSSHTVSEIWFIWTNHCQRDSWTLVGLCFKNDYMFMSNICECIWTHYYLKRVTNMWLRVEKNYSCEKIPSEKWNHMNQETNVKINDSCKNHEKKIRHENKWIVYRNHIEKKRIVCKNDMFNESWKKITWKYL